MNFKNLNAKHVGEIMMSALEGDDPVSFFKDVISEPENKEFFKEFFDMTEIPAGPESEHHPKGETVFYHSMNVLFNAIKISKDPVVRLAAVLHDMGKLATPTDNYPHHYNHDKLGMDLINNFCNRLELDPEVRRICINVSKNHMKTDMKKISKWLRLAMEMESEKELDALKKVIISDSGKDMSEILDKAYKVGQMKISEQEKIKVLKNMLDNPE
jgi:23S rRNA maturation-related 3'-5' exoribonuclease YhaM